MTTTLSIFNLLLWTSILYISRAQNEVEAPPFLNYKCGMVNKNTLIHNGFLESDDSYQTIYALNTTSEELASKGFEIKVEEVKSDVLTRFSYSNGTYSGNMSFSNVGAISATGAKPSLVSRSYYMAQHGYKNGNEITWLCDGVLINLQWILSAAHCFTKPGVKINVVRLGDFNLTDHRDPHLFSGNKFIRDYPIEKVVTYPEFSINERYHDIALIKIPRKIPKHSHNIFPICLPWGSQTNRNLTGMEVAVTGWGVSEYGSKSSILQEVFLNVIDTELCNSAYSYTPDFKSKYPQGMASSKILCANRSEGRRDTCGGATGAPIVYREADNYILAGILSEGFGCSRKQYPELYIPINKPKYLKWIKQVAFQDYYQPGQPWHESIKFNK